MLKLSSHKKINSCFRKCLIIILIFLFTSYPISCFAWWEIGHKVVAKIAYDRLTPKAKVRINKLLSEFTKQYSDKRTFIDLASWPDELRKQNIETFTHWHYIDIPFSADATPIKATIDTDNAIWALTQIKIILRSKSARPIEQARFLAFLIHIVADLHQPLHTVSRISDTHPDGDEGGNLFWVITSDERKINLHALWDSGFGFFDKNSEINIEQRARTITAKYHESYFHDQIKELDPEHWASEGLMIAKQSAYDTEENKSVKSSYTNNGKNATQQRVALAGYRLAALINILFN